MSGTPDASSSPTSGGAPSPTGRAIPSATTTATTTLGSGTLNATANGPPDDVARTGPRTRRRSRPVLWAAIGAAALVAVLIAVVASAQPSSETLGRSALVGNMAPPISGPGLGGGHPSLNALRGRWVLVNFMATWCEPCEQEMPQLLKFAKEHAAEHDATVLTVADDAANVSQLRTFLTSRGATWPAVNDPAATVSYGLSGLPSSFLVAPDGIVVAYLLGQVRAAEVDSWLKKGAAEGFGPA